jgi:CRP-like cAMP-binding protein
MERILNRKPLVLTGIWLSPEGVEASIKPLLLQMLEPNQPHANLRQAVLEELTRQAKRKDVVLEYLGLHEVETDHEGEVVLYLVAPAQEQTPWRDALLLRQSACPIGFVVNTWDYGRVAMVHEIFRQLTPAQQDVIRKYAALAVRSKTHKQILNALHRSEAEADRAKKLLQEARRRMQSLDRSVLFSYDGEVRVQVGSLSQTTKNILREGLRGEYLFILPRHLFEGRTNYADVEFIVYLNFFVRHGGRTRIAGMRGQKEALQRLLNLTIFGLFNPQTPEAPPFAELQRTYGINYETYAFLRLCYELYSVRKTQDGSGPILGIDNYVDFLLLNETGHPTLIPIYASGTNSQLSRLGTIRVLPQPNGTFDVRITQPGGKSTAKRLMVMPPSRVVGTVPEALRQAVQFATDRPRFGVMPLGTSHGFDPVGDLTSFVIWINGRGILVDPSPESLAYLEYIGVAQTDLLDVFLTHIHADHDGGLIEKLLSGSRTTIIASDVVFRLFVEKAQLVTGHNFQHEGLVDHVAANPGEPVLLEVAGEQVLLETRWNLHPIPTNGFKLTMADKCFGYSGDTQYDPNLIQQLQQEKKLHPQQVHDLLYFFWTPEGIPTVDLLYHEAGIPPIHTDRQPLERLPAAVKARTALVHIADRDVPPGAAPGKPPLFVTHTLLPSTAQSQQGILLRTLNLVSYLYDIPTETLQGLVDVAMIRVFAAEEVIIRKGPVIKGNPLTFFVVADGEVAVKDGRRLITKLRKGDSFGEWGISHQRGFRTADVVATRPTQLLEFDEAAYQWVVAKHPVIQERIGRVRALLPRLQLAQALAHQQSREDPESVGNVIEEMTTSQLSAFAVFSVTKKFNQGVPVVVEGDVADGFYILLSGHLAVTIEGQLVAELSEGDVFGELGLIEGGRRIATINVMSADAEVLFMSQQNFNVLLQTVPAFSFGIRATAAQRLEQDRASMV